MNAKTLSLLAVAAVGAAALATFSVKSREAAVAGKLRSGRLFPDLMERVNDVTRLEVTTPKETYHIVRDKDGGWGLEEKAGYPVDFDRVKKTIVAVADLQILERKTSKPELFEKLGLQDPEAEGATSKRLVLLDAQGAPLAGLIVGESKNRGGLQSFFARKTGEDQTWYVEGAVQIDDTGAAWLDKQIVKVERKRIRAVTIHHADGEDVIVAKNQPGDQTLELRNKPADRDLKYATVANGLGSALEWCNLEDVLPAGDVAFPDPPHATATFETFDGLVVRVDTYTDDTDKTYARFEASYYPAKRYEPPPPAADDGGDGDAAGDAAATPPAQPDLKPAGDVELEAKEIAEKVGPWVYVVPQFNRDSFTKRLADLLAEPAPPPAPEGAEAGAGAGEGAGGDGEEIEEIPEEPGSGGPVAPAGGEGEKPAATGGAQQGGVVPATGGAGGETPVEEKPAETPPAEKPAGSGGGG